MCAFVLVADDDPKQAAGIRLYLEREGHTVAVVHDGLSAIRETRRRSPDLLIVDVMMPGADGLEVTRVLRTESELSILMLTARSTEDDLVTGLGTGADDYLVKPYGPRELVARVETLLRRARVPHRPPRTPGPPPLTVGALVVDPARHEVFVSGRPVECTPAEFGILVALATSPGQVFTRPQLLEYLHGTEQYISKRTVTVHVWNLRKKIEPNPRHPVYLLTVFGVGYKLADGTTGNHSRAS
jgi:DNA-binding response OmpR family regulator